MAEVDASIPDVDPDWLAKWIPLPYRCAILVTLGIALWGVNLRVLRASGIDTPSLIKYPPRVSHTDAPHHRSVFRFATGLAIPLAASIFAHLAVTRVFGIQTFLFPDVTLVLLLGVVFLFPTQWLNWISRLMPGTLRSSWPVQGRARLRSMLARVVRGGLADDGSKFGDVLLTDALTSYARPICEVYVSLAMMVTHNHAHDLRLSIIVPLLAAAPFLMRFRQCLLDKQPANAIKYLTALPPLALSHYMKFDSNAKPITILGLPLWPLWLCALLINAIYSFYWDIYRDWDFDLRRYNLRSRRIWEPVEIYWAMVPVDLVLRLAWAFKLSSHLSYYYDLEAGLFLLEILEVVRRFLWVFFRVEAEHFRNGHASREVLLGELGEVGRRDAVDDDSD
ncbi:Hypothetical protein R9X50_00658600 [Acrodontium crateriforme]|uniref:EXS domain-containing protein n=1 Tax=Acrodontium crateriforme TaxID=150365 RepID=A0AAQ3RDP3_9PEZI|nr:Hypothetical protein R9X50_00658600 [Acrodontium crateriforme]